jgi:hypothetical protein
MTVDELAHVVVQGAPARRGRALTNGLPLIAGLSPDRRSPAGNRGRIIDRGM